MTNDDVPVLVAGAGPAGLMAAAALARHGIETLVVERRDAVSDLPRATSVSTRSMELLRGLGLESAIRAGGADVEWVGWQSRTLAAVADGAPFPVGYPTRAQSELVSPTAPACVPQDHLEPVLLEHLAASPGVRVAHRTRLESVRTDGGGVRAALRAAGGGTRVVRARYLIAADGAHSVARRELGIPMPGSPDLGRAFTALFRAPLWDLVGERRHGIYDVTHPDGAGVFLPAGPDDRWMYGLRREPGETLDGEHDLARTLARRIRHGSGLPGFEPTLDRVGTFWFAAQIATRYREGSAFLVGDAAHRVTPRGGTGMNSAMQDGWDLGWKLAWVLRGWASEGLLDTYEAERRPVAEHNAARSADPDGTTRTAATELAVDLGGRMPHLWVARGAARVSTLDLVGPGLTLFTGPDANAWEAAVADVGGAPPFDVRALDEIAARGLGIRASGALLVRPDGVPVAAWPAATGAAASLRAAVRAVRDGGERATRPAVAVPSAA